ncbi:MAG: type II secretion system inner membrane protein GspF [Gammaproteobacteria bacterium]|nr:type II secretion system inner membrane protein GspF [Gammaproteobacteria bacterium]
MGAFEYTAIDTAGKERKGLLEGDTPRGVRQMLRDQGLLPLEITEIVKKEGGARGALSFRRGIGAMDLALLTRQLATLVRSGLPLEESLQAVSEQSEKPRIKSMLLGVRARVMEGHTLADGLNDYPHVFPEIYRATVAAGEQSGFLDGVLERLADYTESRQALQQRVSHALVYPIILTVMAFGIVTLLMTYVVPKVTGVYDSIDQELPLPTKILIGTSDFMRDNGLLLIGAIVLAFFGLRALLKQPGARRTWHRMLLSMPLVGRLIRGFNTASFTRTLNILAGSGVPVLDALRISGAVVVNIPMREAVEDVARRVREGAPIGKSLAISKLFPPMTIHLISSGEASGELPAMLERSASYQEREMDSLVATLLSVLEPAMILLMGALVLAIVIALLLPIFNLNDLIN